MRAFFLLLGLICASSTAAASPTIYVKGIHAYTLGYPKVEFYEAYIVTDAQQLSADVLIKLLRPFCSEFPRLETYMVRVFSDGKWATPQSFDWGLGPPSAQARKDLAPIYLAELRPDGTLTLYPYQEGSKTVAITRGWCANAPR